MAFASSSKNLQPTLSSFFQTSPRKRSSSYIDLTQDEEPVPTVSKRARLSMSISDTNGEFPSRDTLADSWRFSPEKEKQTTSTTAPSAIKDHRREAFKSKLLQDNSLFLRKRSEDTEEVRGDEPYASDGVSEEDERFEKLHEMFAHKSSVQTKGKAKKQPLKKNKPVDVGPSGEPYTPLEKQVC